MPAPRSRRYRFESDATPATTQKDFTKAAERWRVDADGPSAIGGFDFPMPTTIGGRAATIRVVIRGNPVTFYCDKWDTYALNLRACYLSFDQMRLDELRGLTETVRNAYAQLPAGVQERDPYELLGVRSDAPLEDIELMYKAKANRAHPDKGGSDAAMKELNVAIEKIRAERRGRP